MLEFENLRRNSLLESGMSHQLQTLKQNTSRLHHFYKTGDERNRENNGFEVTHEHLRSLKAVESMFTELPNSSSLQSRIVVAEEQHAFGHGGHDSDRRNTLSVSEG